MFFTNRRKLHDDHRRAMARVLQQNYELHLEVERLQVLSEETQALLVERTAERDRARDIVAAMMEEDR